MLPQAMLIHPVTKGMAVLGLLAGLAGVTLNAWKGTDGWVIFFGLVMTWHGFVLGLPTRDTSSD